VSNGHVELRLFSIRKNATNNYYRLGVIVDHGMRICSCTVRCWFYFHPATRNFLWTRAGKPSFLEKFFL